MFAQLARLLRPPCGSGSHPVENKPYILPGFFVIELTDLNQFGGPILTSKVDGTVTISRLTGELISSTLKGLSRNELIVMTGDIIKLKVDEKPEIQARKQIDWGKITDRILGISTTLYLFLVYLNR